MNVFATKSDEMETATMQEVITALNREEMKFPPRDGSDKPGFEFRTAAKKWAAHSLETYQDDLLTKALAVSKSIAEFCNELESRKYE